MVYREHNMFPVNHHLSYIKIPKIRYDTTISINVGLMLDSIGSNDRYPV